MTPSDFAEALSVFKDTLAKAGKDGRILIAAHERPDGDAVGSLSGLTTVLRENGYNAFALDPRSVPDNYTKFMPQPEMMAGAAEKDSCVLFIAVDASTEKRVSADGFDTAGCRFSLCIDHHADNKGYCRNNIISPDSAAASELVYRLVSAAGMKISPLAATRLLLGVITDSGCFRFDNTTPDTLRCAAELVGLGADRHGIIVEAYLSKEPCMAKFEAEIVANRMKTAFDGKFAWAVFDAELYSRFGVDDKNTETCIDVIRNIKGVEFAVILREREGGFKFSIRTKNAPYSAANVAHRLNGGGHEMAAGGFIPGVTAAEAEKIILENVKTELEKQ